ncbi:hypothetical protein FLONG3_478 [Fusarium longipes]|uniref:3CxxC-type domain-containing protein n=1 Tax=Fusarium longipes TaxID=694270 RepID=A0A395T9A8_9HYPO|nr:hypothetical protein FLONG3_478 [Fusarium longipes]
MAAQALPNDEPLSLASLSISPNTGEENQAEDTVVENSESPREEESASPSSPNESDGTEKETQHGNTPEQHNEPDPVTTGKPSPAPPKYSMYPDLHDLVKERLGDDLEYSFRDHDTGTGIKNEHDTAIMGCFLCYRHGPTCRRWYSNRIAVTIREYEDDSYNVRVYHQLCLSCWRPARPTIEGDDKLLYADRVAYHLKKWNNIHAEQPKRNVEPNGQHKKKLCQGCINGHCKIKSNN